MSCGVYYNMYDVESIAADTDRYMYGPSETRAQIDRWAWAQHCHCRLMSQHLLYDVTHITCIASVGAIVVGAIVIDA